MDKYAKVEDRWELVKGLMDSDGDMDERGHAEYVSVSKVMCDDMMFVLRSLGFKVTQSEKETTFTYTIAAIIGKLFSLKMRITCIFYLGVKRYLLPVVDVIAYCLMPTHYHFMVRVKDLEQNSNKQTSEVSKTSEVSAGMQKLLISYTTPINNTLNIWPDSSLKTLSLKNLTTRSITCRTISFTASRRQRC